MSMVARCPSCATAFRVTPEQLRTGHGRVRCGRCRTVFNAFDSLTTPSEPPAPEPAAKHEASAAESITQDLVGRTGAAWEPLAEKSPPVSRPAAPILPAINAAAVITPMSWSGPGVRRRGRWVQCCCLILAGQAAYQFRTGLATALPGTRPFLESLCAYFSCTVALPQRVEYLNIEASDLKADPQRAEVILFSATLRNNAPLAQGFPAIELTPTDTQDRPVARRVFLPADYLGKKADPRPGIAPSGAVDIRMALGTTDLQAAGYRLYLFYP